MRWKGSVVYVVQMCVSCGTVMNGRSMDSRNYSDLVDTCEF